MRKRMFVPLVGVAGLVGLAAPLAIPTAALAHGHVTSPASRQAYCASGQATNCGQIQYEPQSVEGPKGFPGAGPADGRICSAGISTFSPLDRSTGWPATSVRAGARSFSWRFTAMHATASWDYYITSSGPTVTRANLTRIGSVSGGGARPPANVTHTVTLPSRTGRQVVLAVWTIADTANAFYSCIDVDFSGGTPTTPPTTAPPTTPPTTTPTTTPPTTAPPSGTWTTGTAYRPGDRVTYNGRAYQCRQAHTALPGWEPPNTPALWSAG